MKLLRKSLFTLGDPINESFVRKNVKKIISSWIAVIRKENIWHLKPGSWRIWLMNLVTGEMLTNIEYDTLCPFSTDDFLVLKKNSIDTKTWDWFRTFDTFDSKWIKIDSVSTENDRTFNIGVSWKYLFRNDWLSCIHVKDLLTNISYSKQYDDSISTLEWFSKGNIFRFFINHKHRFFHISKNWIEELTALEGKTVVSQPIASSTSIVIANPLALSGDEKYSLCKKDWSFTQDHIYEFIQYMDEDRFLAILDKKLLIINNEWVPIATLPSSPEEITKIKNGRAFPKSNDIVRGYSDEWYLFINWKLYSNDGIFICKLKPRIKGFPDNEFHQKLKITGISDCIINAIYEDSNWKISLLYNFDWTELTKENTDSKLSGVVNSYKVFWKIKWKIIVSDKVLNTIAIYDDNQLLVDVKYLWKGIREINETDNKTLHYLWNSLPQEKLFSTSFSNYPEVTMDWSTLEIKWKKFNKNLLKLK